jgi:hypothetical protein
MLPGWRRKHAKRTALPKQPLTATLARRTVAVCERRHIDATYGNCGHALGVSSAGTGHLRLEEDCLNALFIQSR